MFRTLRELFSVIHKEKGLRFTVLMALLALLAAPIILVVFLFGMVLELLGLLWRAILWPWRERGVGKRVIDPVFGPMSYEGASTWSGEVDLKALGGRLSVTVAAPAEGPVPAHQALLCGLIERQDDIRRQVEASLYRHYQVHAPLWRKEFESMRSVAPDLAAQLLKALPVLDRPAQIWTLLSEGSITLDEEPGVFSLHWDCAWDTEQGVSADFVDWTIDDSE